MPYFKHCFSVPTRWSARPQIPFRLHFITQSYLKTRDLERVARAVGHRELATTRRYLRLGAVLEDHPVMLMDLLPHRGPRPR